MERFDIDRWQRPGVYGLASARRVGVDLPAQVAHDISLRATQLARGRAPKRTGIGARSLRPTRASGKVGITVPAQYRYMIYQNDGTKPHVMWELAGKTVPIRTANGTIFRYANPNKIGKQVVARDERGQIIGTKIAWRHPGVQAQHFLETSLRDAISEWARKVTPREVHEHIKSSPHMAGLVRRIEQV